MPSEYDRLGSPSDYVKRSTPDYMRYTEGYYYVNTVTGLERSQDEMKAAARDVWHIPTTGMFQPGNSDFFINLITTDVLVPRLYTQAENAAWGGVPGGWSDYQASLWGTDPDKAYAQFLANVPSIYKKGGIGSAAGAIAKNIPSTSTGNPPVITSGGDPNALYLTLDNLPTGVGGAQPQRGLAPLVNNTSLFTSGASTPMASGGGMGMILILLAVAGGLWYLSRSS